MKSFMKLVPILSLLTIFTGTALHAQALPDLVVSRIFIVERGPICEINVEIENRGSGTIPRNEFDSARIRFFRNGRFASGYRLGGIDQSGILRSPGGRLTLRLPASNAELSPGRSVTVRAYVDYPNAGTIRESNENNNELTATVTCNIPLPDLAVTDIYPVKVSNGRCTVYAKIENLGPGRIYNEYYRTKADFFKNGTLSSADTYSFDRNGELRTPRTSRDVLFPAGVNLLDPGERAMMKAVIDSTGQVRESNENNNALSKQIECEPLPNLAVTAIGLHWTRRGCRLTLSLANKGGSMNSAGLNQIGIVTRIGSRYKGVHISECDRNLSLSQAGASVTCILPESAGLVGLGAGANVGVTVDPRNILVEGDKNDNRLSRFLICPRVSQTYPGKEAIPGGILDEHRIPVR